MMYIQMQRLTSLAKNILSNINDNRNAIFTGSFMLYVFTRGIEMAKVQTSYSIFFEYGIRLVQVCALVAALFLVMLTVRQHCMVTNLALAILGIFFLASSLTNKSFELVWILVYVVAAETVDLRQIPRCVFRCSIIVLLVVFTLRAVGVAESVAITRSDNSALRESLGFYHPNRLVEIVLLMLTSWVIDSIERPLGFNHAIMLTIILATYCVTGTKTILIAAPILILLSIIYKKIGNFAPKVLARALPLVFAIIGIASIAVTLLYTDESQILSWINQLLSGRLIYPSALFAKVGIPIFGINMEETVNMSLSVPYYSAEIIPIDNFFVHTIFYNGIVVLAVEFVLCCALSRLLDDKNEYGKFMLGLIMCLFFGISESYVGDIAFNYYVLAFSAVAVAADRWIKNKMISKLR